MDDLARAIELLQGDGAPYGMFVVFIIGLMREWWVMGGAYRAAQAERDRAIEGERLWRDAALKERSTLRRAVDTAEAT